jgi:hypothetical protein
MAGISAHTISCRTCLHLHQAAAQLQGACCKICHCIQRAGAIWKSDGDLASAPHAMYTVKLRKVMRKDLQEQLQALLVRKS